MTSDPDLLRQYADHGDEAAFAEVVRRQADLVYSVALRVTANGALAQEVTQTVFTLMARRAAALAHYDTLVGWLHTTTRHTAINAVRGEARRHTREQEAAAMQDLTTTPEVNWTEIGPLLDEAVGQLRDNDRKAVLLRFFKNQSHQEIGAALGLSEDTARKRVERALEKLRGRFAQRGVTTTSAILATSISVNSVQAAPAGLTALVMPTALASVGKGGMHGAHLAFMSAKTKAVIAFTALVLMVGGIAAFSIHEMGGSSAPIRATAPLADLPLPQTDTPPESTPAVELPSVAAVAPGSPSWSIGPVLYSLNPQPQAKLEDAVNEAIIIYQAGDIDSIIKFKSPVQLRDVAFVQDVPGMVQGFNLTDEQYQQNYRALLLHDPDFFRKTANIVQALQSIQGTKPELRDNGTTAVYKVNPPIGGMVNMVFHQVDGKWYFD